MKDALKCPTCKFSKGIRCYAELSVDVEITPKGEIIEQEGRSIADLNEKRIFCGNCGDDLRLVKEGESFRLAKVEIASEPPKAKPKKILGFTVPTRANLAKA